MNYSRLLLSVSVAVAVGVISAQIGANWERSMAEQQKRVAKKIPLAGGITPDKPPHERLIDSMENLQCPAGGGPGLCPREGISPLIDLVTSKSSGAAFHLVETPFKTKSKMLIISNTDAAGAGARGIRDPAGKIREIVEVPNSFGRYQMPEDATPFSDDELVTDRPIPIYAASDDTGSWFRLVLWYPVSGKFTAHELEAGSTGVLLYAGTPKYFYPQMLSSDLMLIVAQGDTTVMLFVFSLARIESYFAAGSIDAVPYEFVHSPLDSGTSTEVSHKFRLNEALSPPNPAQNGVWNLALDFAKTGAASYYPHTELETNTPALAEYAAGGIEWLELTSSGTTVKSHLIGWGSKIISPSGGYYSSFVADIPHGSAGPYSFACASTGYGVYRMFTAVPIVVDTRYFQVTDSSGYYTLKSHGIADGPGASEAVAKTTLGTYVGIVMIDQYWDHNINADAKASCLLMTQFLHANGDVIPIALDIGQLVLCQNSKLLLLTSPAEADQTYCYKYGLTGTTPQERGTMYRSDWTTSDLYSYSSGGSSYSYRKNSDLLDTTLAVEHSVTTDATLTNITHLQSLGGYEQTTWFTHDTSSNGTFELSYVNWTATTPTVTTLCTLTTGTLKGSFRLDSTFAVFCVYGHTGYGATTYVWIKVNLVSGAVAVINMAPVDTLGAANPLYYPTVTVATTTGWTAPYPNVVVPMNPSRFLTEFGYDGQ